MSHKLRAESQSKKKSSSTKVTPFDGNEDLFGRLSSAVGTPEADAQKVVEEEVPNNQEKEEESEKMNMKDITEMAMNWTMLWSFSWV